MKELNERNRVVRSRLLRRYYKSAVLGWFKPRTLHWAKTVDSDGNWRWRKADRGIKGRLLRDPPIHVYQTVLRFKAEGPPRGHRTHGYLLGGPLLFDIDIIDKMRPFSLWRIMDCAGRVQQLMQTVADRGGHRVARVMFSGFRGVHVSLESENQLCHPVPLNADRPTSYLLRDLKRERSQTARSIGKWCPGWDWKVSADLWRVSRVPWSIHGRSALRAMVLKPPYTGRSFREQLKAASPFSLNRQLRVRITKPVPIFTFVDEESYGPFREGWVTRLPIAVALHLVWQDMAKPRDPGPWSAGAWFEKGWQILFRRGEPTRSMVKAPAGGTAG